MARRRPTSVAEEIGQRVPFRSRGQEAMVALLRTTNEVRSFVTRGLEGTGLTLQQYNVLRILRGAGAEGLPTLTVGERMVERQPGVTRLVDRLIRKGLVARRRGVEDRRQVLCAITAKGLALLESLDPHIHESDEFFEAVFDPERLALFVLLLDEVRAGVRDAAAADAGSGAA
jgi:DNA-binding MarR family transcriptional regulator